jgi:hypothetical protein
MRCGGEHDMEVRYLILARYAEFTGDGMLNLIGGDYDKLIAGEFPYVHSLMVSAARVVLNRDECEYEHKFNSFIIDDETNELIAEGTSGDLPKFVMPAGVNHLGAGMILPFQHVIFPRPGVYIVQLAIDDVVLAKARFRVATAAYYQDLGKAVQAMQGDTSNA